MPDVIRAGELFIKGAGLKKYRVGEDDDSPCRLEIRARPAQPHQVNPKQTDLDHVASDVGDGHAVADAHAEAADEEEVGHAGENHSLQRDCDTGSDQASESCQRSKFAHHAEDHDDQYDDADHQPAHHHQLALAPRVLNVTERASLPDFREYKDEHDYAHHRPDA